MLKIDKGQLGESRESKERGGENTCDTHISDGKMESQCQMKCQKIRFRDQYKYEASSPVAIIYKRNVSKLVPRFVGPFS